eukprot:NODE_2661_length_1124_cov_25.259779_g2539_i0.p1 GENE.NODE_2661_length_1124_cov_25.259779_g2539_i0~~NODE_2661_length_1124_cov_25.259779_g2539_i0.p1  ORF type:complete len:348 (+),score=33.63 NODE_2661_length_1124_cov_25.259779_g2539_i0:17-1060(+)
MGYQKLYNNGILAHDLSRTHYLGCSDLEGLHLEFLAMGAMKSVYLANTTSGHPMAIKRRRWLSSLCLRHPTVCAEQFVAEAAWFTRLHSSTAVLTMHGFCTDPLKQSIAVEYFPGGSLHDAATPDGVSGLALVRYRLRMVQALVRTMLELRLAGPVSLCDFHFGQFLLKDPRAETPVVKLGDLESAYLGPVNIDRVCHRHSDCHDCALSPDRGSAALRRQLRSALIAGETLCLPNNVSMDEMRQRLMHSFDPSNWFESINAMTDQELDRLGLNNRAGRCVGLGPPFDVFRVGIAFSNYLAIINEHLAHPVGRLLMQILPRVAASDPQARPLLSHLPSMLQQAILLVD